MNLTPFRKLVNLARIRQGRVLTVQAMAGRCGVCRQYLYLLMAGPRPHTQHATIIRLSDGLGVSRRAVQRALGAKVAKL